MTEIRIKEFRGYSQDDIYEFLRIHKRNFYQVIIPKEYSLEKDDIVFTHDYYRAIYIGQLLWRMSCDIGYSCPEPFEVGEFRFFIITAKLKKLAALLYRLVNAYDRENNEDAYIDFEIEAADMDGYMKEGEEYACRNYVEFLNEYLEDQE
jgi:hypothetical protein